MTNGRDQIDKDRLTLTKSNATPELVGLILQSHSDLVILPLRYSADGRGIYGQSTVTLAKELRASGVNASFLDGSTNRVFEVKKGYSHELIQLAISLGQEATVDIAWSQLKLLLRRKHPKDQKLEITYVKIAGEYAEVLQANGYRDDVLDALDKVLGHSNLEEI